jgi:hypothetical protein
MDAASIQQFIHSDAGEVTGWALLVLGAGDLLFAWWYLPRHPEIFSVPGFRNLFTPSLFGSIFFTLLGLYLLVRHG